MPVENPIKQELAKSKTDGETNEFKWHKIRPAEQTSSNLPVPGPEPWLASRRETGLETLAGSTL